MTAGWYVDIIDDTLRNPQGEVFCYLRKDLSAIKREELRKFIEDGIREAEARVRYEYEHAHSDPEDFDIE
jgi:hypothetical protein